MEEFRFIQSKIRTDEITTTGLKKQLANKNKKNELINKEKILDKFKELSTITNDNINADNIVIISKDEYKELIEILKLLLDFYVSKQK